MEAAAKYRHLLDEAYFFAHRDRHARAARKLVWITNTIVVLVLGLFLFFSAVAIADGQWLKALVPALVLVVFLYYRRKYGGEALRAFRKDPGFGFPVEIELAAAGVRTAYRTSEHTVTWEEFDKARSFGDGLLVESKRGYSLWLADQSLVAGTRPDAERLLREHVKDFRHL